VDRADRPARRPDRRQLPHGGDGDDALFANDGITDAVLDGGTGSDRAKKDSSDPLLSVESIL
jgi:hypothetical protein